MDAISGYIGNSIGGTGSMTVNGAGSRWTSLFTLTIGEFGTGALFITEGGAVNSDSGYIGAKAGASGEVTVAGAGSSWNFGGSNLSVGSSGAGELTISDGGTVTVDGGTGGLYLGVNPGSSGTLSIGEGGSAGVLNATSVISLNSTDSSTINFNHNEGAYHFTHDGTASGTPINIGQGRNISVNHIGSGTTYLFGTNNYTGGTTVSAGTLVGDTGSLRGDIVNNATLVFEQSGAGTYSGALSGGGALIKRGAGNLTISVAPGYTGPTTVAAGTLSFTGDDLELGDLTLAGGDLALTPGDGNAQAGAVSVGAGSTFGIGDGDWVLVDSLSGAGTVQLADQFSTLSITGNTDTTFTGNFNGDGDLFLEGSGTLTLQGGTHALGGYLLVGNCGCGGTANGLILDGVSLAAGTGTAVGNGLLALRNNAQTVTGDLMVDALGTLRIEAGSSLDFVGSGLIGDQGLLVANGTLSGELTLDDGGTLMGSGRVGDIVLLTGATLAPGNSIGTLAVDGDLTLMAGSRYQVEVDPASTASDLIAVTGDATLAGAVIHIGENGAYRPFSEYTILTAEGAISGEFDSVSSEFAFLAPSLGYTAEAVTLTLERNATDFADTARTHNQRSTAGGVDSVGDGDVYNTVLGLSAAQAPGGFDALSGEAHVSTQGALQQHAASLPRRGLGALRGNLGAGLRPGEPTASAGGFTPEAALPRGKAYPLWLEARGQDARLDADGNAARLEQRSYGLQAGGDAPLGEWRLGGAFGYADQELQVKGRASEAETNSYQLALYAGRNFELGAGRAHVIGGAGWAHHEIASRRRVVFPGFSESLRADYDARTRQLFAEAGYTLPLTEQLSLTPYLALDWSEQRTEGFREEGGGAALHADTSRNRVSTATLGLQATHRWDWRSREGALSAELGWRHAEGDLAAESEYRFAGGQKFTVAGAPIAQDAAVLGLGLDLALSEQAALGLRYDGQFGAGNRAHSAELELRWRF